MRFITFRFFVITCFILISLMVINAQSSVVSKHDLKKLAKCMTGTFSSQKQSLLDSTFFHISLHMTPIWKKSKDGFWLYVEQAMATGLDKPYRQRIYHLFGACRCLSVCFFLAWAKQFDRRNEQILAGTTDQLLHHGGFRHEL